jgi:transketolase
MALHDKEMRQVYAETLIDLIAANRQIMVLEADLSRSSGTPSVATAWPQNFLDVGIAEANMIGVAAGLSTCGKIPFCATFTPFASRRCYDQVTISVAYSKRNVKIVGTSPGVTTTANGGTHMCFQDLAIMRAMPGMTVLAPCDVYELRSMLHWMAATDGPRYMQLLRMKEPQIFEESYTFRPGQAVRLREGRAATLVTTGYTTRWALEAADALAREGLSVDLLHYPMVKPFDADALVASARKTGHVVTVENQNILGGLGGTVCEVLSEHWPTPVRRLGVHDVFGEVATEAYLLEKHRFGPAHIAAAVRERPTRPVAA